MMLLQFIQNRRFSDKNAPKIPKTAIFQKFRRLRRRNFWNLGLSPLGQGPPIYLWLISARKSARIFAMKSAHKLVWKLTRKLARKSAETLGWNRCGNRRSSDWECGANISLEISSKIGAGIRRVSFCLPKTQ